ncbi:MAG: PDZ domain-containing protein, partial [Limnobacter sp.]|nr:PDZ domain-containing protein [Limnobacter sp.]
KNSMLHYLVSLEDPNGHYLDVTLQATVTPRQLPAQENGAPVLNLWLPTWIPGSYLIREFSRNVVSFSARLNTLDCQWQKPTKNRWQVELPVEYAGQEDCVLECQWRVYCWDLSVRGAHFDQTHAFFNGTSLFLMPEGMEQDAIEMTLSRPACEAEPWLVATGLPYAEDQTREQIAKLTDGCQILPTGGSLKYRADTYEALLDHPFEMGRLHTAEFTVCGVSHYFAVYGADDDLDLDRICSDLTPVCEAQIRMFSPEGKAPFDCYYFLLHATDKGYGGLEHRNSTALLCNREDLPQKGVKEPPKGYEQFMGLCSHEYFHSWNVKRIKPEVFTPYELNNESYTRLLWVFEGFTSYYDDLMLARGGFHDEKAYLNALCKSIAQVMKGPGRVLQSVSESSFEAWTKYYRQDENAPNAIVSYYTKGALVALCLDLTIRKKTNGDKSLDDVMRFLWAHHGETGKGVPERAMPNIVEQATGVNLTAEINAWTNGTEDLPLTELLNEFGCDLNVDDEGRQCGLGVVGAISSEGMKVRSVLNGSPTHEAGVAAGDVLVSIGPRKLTDKNLKRFLQGTAPGTPVLLVGFRAESLMTFDVMT